MAIHRSPPAVNWSRTVNMSTSFGLTAGWPTKLTDLISVAKELQKIVQENKQWTFRSTLPPLVQTARQLPPWKNAQDHRSKNCMGPGHFWHHLWGTCSFISNQTVKGHGYALPSKWWNIICIKLCCQSQIVSSFNFLRIWVWFKVHLSSVIKVGKPSLWKIEHPWSLIDLQLVLLCCNELCWVAWVAWVSSTYMATIMVVE